jgi:hypothetical protein
MLNGAKTAVKGVKWQNNNFQLFSKFSAFFKISSFFLAFVKKSCGDVCISQKKFRSWIPVDILLQYF